MRRCFNKNDGYLLLVVVVFFLGLFFLQTAFVLAPVTNCVTTPKILRVHGNSMRPFLEPETERIILEGYYVCHPVERGDIVVHRYASKSTPIVKSVRAIAGDTLALVSAQSPTPIMLNKWNIIINGTILVNDAGVPYAISEGGYRMLSLYIRDYRGLVPRGSVLLLGENPNGSIDGIRLGLTSVSDLIGKVKK